MTARRRSSRSPGLRLACVLVTSLVAVSGCGPIGCFAIGVAAASGASRIFVSDVEDTRLQMAKSMGATDLFNARTTNVREAILEAPRYTDASLNLGRLYQQAAGKDETAVDKALAVYEAVLASEPAHAEARYQCAVLRQARGDFARRK